MVMLLVWGKLLDEAECEDPQMHMIEKAEKKKIADATEETRTAMIQMNWMIVKMIVVGLYLETEVQRLSDFFCSWYLAQMAFRLIA
jgi:hypothetical protein